MKAPSYFAFMILAVALLGCQKPGETTSDSGAEEDPLAELTDEEYAVDVASLITGPTSDFFYLTGLKESVVEDENGAGLFAVRSKPTDFDGGKYGGHYTLPEMTLAGLARESEREVVLGWTALSADGRELASLWSRSAGDFGASEFELAVWDLEAGTLLHSVKVPTFQQVEYLPNRSMVVMTGKSGELRLKHLDEEAEDKELDLGVTEVWSIQVTEDENFVLVNGKEKLVVVELKTKETVFEANIPSESRSRFSRVLAQLSPDGKLLAWTMDRKKIVAQKLAALEVQCRENIRELEQFETEIELDWKNARIEEFAFDSEAKQLAAIAKETVMVWDVSTQTESSRLLHDREFVNCFCFSPDRRKIITGTKDGGLVKWDLSTARIEGRLQSWNTQRNKQINAVHWGRGQEVVISSTSSAVEIWGPETWEAEDE